MNNYKWLLCLPCLWLTLGCGSSGPAEPPPLTSDVQAQIEAEDAAIEEAERNNS